MKYSWLQTVFPIAAIFSFRMLGLFMLIPVFTVLAKQLEDATPALTGLALGSYGLTQGLLQMPLGMLSDRFGRKPILTLGLLLFALGSLLGAFSHSIYSMIIARTLQGTGAIGSVLIALIADLTPDEQRTKAMAVIGMTIGLSFSLAMIISPALTHHFGLAGIFYLTAGLALLGLLLLHLIIPTPAKERFHGDSEANPTYFKTVISNRHLQRLNLGIFFQHFILTSTFYAIPLLLQQQIRLGHLHQQWHFYLPIMFISFMLMVPFIILAEKKRQMKVVFCSAVLLTAATQFLLVFYNLSWFILCALMLIYFIAFNVLEATLPSLISKQANPGMKGTAMGIYSSSQFLGIFLGGTFAGLLYQLTGSAGIFMINGLLGGLWLIVALFMKPNIYLSNLTLPYSAKANDIELIVSRLKTLKGVIDFSVAESEQVIYLRVDKTQYVDGSAGQLLAEYSNSTS
ncbi:MFS transporter [Legionella jordanis]|uniref:Transporter, major facilitator family n=1 Tax=Legionella jordanis TaxID=456 RepID=A0A0W0VBY0_9GAMM|nr:MFS transporter [Legionella jordanis]KTD17617.1 transporter, major facilitator family [Legionella jordanis]RMX00898.1 MFS transporter [Legionella jordanis]RMX17889.1 MFS transporter [Legionella jordanis]VEH11461.1 transporter, major facilitator family [Legionella jordanis]HAT8714922.1 MFS transporter [Legionella jordanis]